MGTEPEVQGGPVGPAPMPEAAPEPMAEPAPMMNIWTILLLVSGVLVLAGFFLDWMSNMGFGFTGMNLATGKMSVMGVTVDLPESYPEVFIVPVMGILIIILPFVKLPIGSMIMGIIAFIIPIEVLARIDSGFSYIAIGAILCIVGGILAFIIGFLAWRKS